MLLLPMIPTVVVAPLMLIGPLYGFCRRRIASRRVCLAARRRQRAVHVGHRHCCARFIDSAVRRSTDLERRRRI